MNDYENDLQKHFGPWPDEKCWNINETLPIKINIKKSWTGKYYVLFPDAMTMTYKTYEHLGMNHCYSKLKVSHNSYDYKTGEASFSADSMQDIKKWFDMYSTYIVKCHN